MTEALEVRDPGHGPARGYTWPPFEVDNEAALKHGATSERHIRPLAMNHRRRVLRQLRLRASDIDAVGRAYLEHYCRLTAKVVLLDEYLDREGLLDETGTPRPCLRLYMQVTRGALDALGKIERHLGAREGDPFAALYDHLAELRDKRGDDG